MSAHDTTSTLEILGGPPHGRSTLMEDYLAGADALQPFYFGSPHSLQTFRRKMEEVGARFDAAARAAMAEAIRPTSEAAASRLERVVEEGGFFVTSGQQPGLFGGPLYTLYKILSAMSLADALEARVGVPVAPLFWVGSDDHDWAEVNHTWVLDTSNAMQRIEVVQPEDTPPHSMARRRLAPGIDGAIADLSKVLPDTEFTDVVIKQIRDAYRPERSMGEAFEELIAAWLQSQDLLLVQAASPQVKRIAAPLLRDDLARSEEAEAATSRQTERLEEVGYRAQVALIAGATNVLFEDEKGRGRILRTEDGFLAHDGAVRWTREELLQAVQREPTAFSPNVQLRPLVESRVFPTICYVAGPAEISYFAQLGCLFRMHGMAMPVVYPRRGGVLVEPKVRKVLDKFGLAVGDLAPPLHEIASRFARDELPEPVARGLTDLRRGIQEGYQRLEEAVRSVDPTLKGPLNSARGSSFKELGHFEKKVLRQLKEQNEISLQQLEKARANLFPDGKPQERVLSPVHFLSRYGPGLIDTLLERFRIEDAFDQEDPGGDGCA